MKTLIVEDDFTSCRLMEKYLDPDGIGGFAVNGREAGKAFSQALEEGKPYKFICPDMIMPEMDGKEVLVNIPHMETEKEVREQDCEIFYDNCTKRFCERVVWAFLRSL